MANISQNEVHHNRAFQRFELPVDGSMAVMNYRMDGSTMIIIHTGVPAELEGRGLGSLLVRAGLEYARENSLGVIPVCWFVEGYIERHPEYKDMLVSP